MPALRILACAIAMLLALALLATDADAQQSASVTEAHTTVRVVAEQMSVQPGTTFQVGLDLTMDPHWHTYWINPGDAGLTTKVKWTLPEGVIASDIHWPTPIKFGQDIEIIGYGYEGRVLLPVNITVPKNYSQDTLALTAKITWLACEEICIPGSAELTLKLPVSDAQPQPSERWAERFEKAMADQPQSFEKKGDAAAYRNDEKIVLAFHVPSDANIEQGSIEFYPSQLGTIDGLAAQRSEKLNSEVYEVYLTPSDILSEPLKKLEGVLVISGEEYNRNFWIDLEVWDEKKSICQVEDSSQSSGDIGSVLSLLGYAIIGGLILNLMPCVFPVLALKITGFVGQAGDSRGKIAGHGFAFAAGVIVSFWVIAGVVIAIQATGQQLGWGFQLQNPIFVGLMALVLFAVGLNFAGVFDVGVSVMNAAGKASGQLDSHSLSGTFGSGVLATALATPCSAPFMASAVGVALASTPIVTFAILTALGVGMALPYVLLSVFPGWLKLLPKAGPWMETFKQLMAFPMFAVVIWLVWVFNTQTGGGTGLLGILGGLLLASLALWALGRWGVPSAGGVAKAISRLACVALLALAVLLLILTGQTADAVAQPVDGQTVTTEGHGLAWQPWSREAVQAARDNGQPVFIDFTADWCASCKFNERVFIDKPVVQAAVAKHNVAVFKADYTNHDDDITQALAEFGVRSVPLYVFYSPGDEVEPIHFSSMFSSSAVVNAIEKISLSSE